MTQYARVSNNQVVSYPLSQLDIQLRHPHISFVRDHFVPPPGYVVVHEVLPPDVDHTQNVVPGAPELIQDVWTQTWQIVPASNAEIDDRCAQQMMRVRSQRDQLLRESDYTRMDDVPLTTEQKQAWAEYRQQLRDLSLQPNWPWQVTWPQKP